MMESNKEILNFCLEKGFLLDNDLLSIFSEISDVNSIKLIIEKIKTYTGQNVLTKNLFKKNQKEIIKFFSDLPPENQKKLEKLKIKLGLSIEISKEKYDSSTKNSGIINSIEDIQIFSHTPKIRDKKPVVKDFTCHFINRFNYFKNLLQNYPNLDNLISIDKVYGTRQGISIIGMVYNKRVTKNKNIILEVEDTTGKIKLLVNKSKDELYKIAENICLDSVLGFKCSGNQEILFVNEIVFPEAILPERKFSPVEEYALFIGDLHYGSNLFLEDNFMNFIDYLNGKISNTDKEEIKKIKYLFILGDIIAGVGIYPFQEKELKIKDVEQQFIGLTKLLSKIPKHIKIIISPGNHDCVRLMEPQPAFDEKYSWPLEELSNVIITENPCTLNFGAKTNFSGFNILTYHGFSYPYYSNSIPSLAKIKSMNCPEEIMKYLLKNRHLAPSHSSTQYYPHKKDRLLITTVPDIFVSGHTHKCGVTYFNNILIISTSCWEAMTSYQKKFGNKPDHCKVPILNLKTRRIKILDFEK